MKAHRFLLITALAVVAMLVTTGVVFAALGSGTVQQETDSAPRGHFATVSGGQTGPATTDHTAMGGDESNLDSGGSMVGGGSGNASVATQDVDKQSTVTTIAAAAGGSTEPPLDEDAARGYTVKNNDFVIERTGGDDILGNGIDEDTLWTLDFRPDPDFRRFQEALKKEGLRSAQLTIALIPQNRLISTDTLRVGDLPPIGATKNDGGANPFEFPPFQSLPLDIVSIVEIELLSFYTPDEVLGVLRKAPRGRVPMRFGDDAVVVFAHLRLTVDSPRNQKRG